MKTKLRILLVTVIVGLFSNSFFAQNNQPADNESAKQEDEFARKKVETKMTEVIATDSLGASDLLKRAVNWIKIESINYKKSSGNASSNKVECSAIFPVKPKQLNPEVDYTGKITMMVVIECKDSKYKFTVSDIRHVSKNGNTSGGSIDNLIPESGSQAMNDLVWKKLKGEALRNAAIVVGDLKEGMKNMPPEKGKEAW